jgi:Holliday junction resolvase RusA-like endonuclease
MKIVIPGELPTMNEIIEAAKTHWTSYREMKQDNTLFVALIAKRLPRCSRVDVIITWYRKDKRSDKDNIMAGQKFILDGLKEAGVIGNDGWKHIGRITHDFAVDKHKPRVEVELLEVAPERAG